MRKTAKQLPDSNDIFQQSLKTAYQKVPFYRNLYKQQHINISQIKLTEINKLPITYQEVLRNQPLDLLAQPVQNILQVISSSGTTGKPKISFITNRQDLCQSEFSDKMCGVKTTDTIVTVINRSDGSNFSSIPRWRKKGLRVIQIHPDLIESNPILIIDLLKKVRASIIKGYPNRLYQITKWAQDNNVDLRSIKIRVIWLSGSYLTRNIRKYLTRQWNAEIFLSYGCNEIGNLGIECHKHLGMHINTKNVYIETINPSTNQPVSPGKIGNILLTTFRNNNISLIRYAVGDIGIIRHTKCKCGITGSMIWPLGRADEAIKLTSIKTIIRPYMIFQILEKFPKLSGRFCLLMEKEKEKKYREKINLYIEILEKKFSHYKTLQYNILKKLFDQIPQLKKASNNKTIDISLKFTKPGFFITEWGRKPQSLIIDNRI